jgi:hypothetical protein|tara:strand:- start:305 stop:640 length:336 start_codon:yes stop_codon:yes gene_type:complete
MTQHKNQQTRRAKIKDQPFVNLLIPIGSDAGRADLEEQRARIRKINRKAAKKIFVPFSTNIEQRKAAIELRAKGRKIVSGLPGQVPDFEDLECMLQLTEVNGQFIVMPVNQ